MTALFTSNTGAASPSVAHTGAALRTRRERRRAKGRQQPDEGRHLRLRETWKPGRESIEHRGRQEWVQASATGSIVDGGTLG